MKLRLVWFTFLKFWIFSVSVTLLFSSCELTDRIVEISGNVRDAVWGTFFGAKFAPDPYYLVGGEKQKEELTSLFTLLHEADQADATEEERFALVREIAAVYMRLDEFAVLDNFLSVRVNKFPDTPFNSYYLLMIAHSYMQREAHDIAELYFEMILKNYPDLLVQEQSIHLACLNNLLVLSDDPRRRVTYYEELIEYFPEQTDLAVSYFLLGQAYEHTGDWILAIQAYSQFLSFVGVNVPGFPDAEQYARQLVDFNNSSKDWTFASLEALVNTMKSSIAEGDAWRLWGYRAKVNFFTRSWADQQDSDDAGMADFILPAYMQGDNVKYAASLDPSSSATEAYLRTWGWSQFVSTWYLYFRKIYFPLNPEIHGRWEWAGIYYGEKF